MNIAVYSDKFSGTLSASEVIEIVKETFQNNSIKASYFPVTCLLYTSPSPRD